MHSCRAIVLLCFVALAPHIASVLQPCFAIQMGHAIEPPMTFSASMPVRPAAMSQRRTP